MPEFILDTSPAKRPGYRAWSNLDAFAQGFIEALFFCETSNFDSSEWNKAATQRAIEEGQADGTIPSDAGVADLDADSVASVAAFCAEFQAKAADLLQAAYALDYDESQAGRDLYFTSAGHGVGYWDRDQLDTSRQLWADMGSPRVDDSRWQEFQAARGETLGEKLTALVPRAEWNPDSTVSRRGVIRVFLS